MASKTQSASELEMSYFEIQAYVGTTKHLGGFDTTQELIGRCEIDGDNYVLEVGCGVGATACYLAKHYGCRVMGVDLRESMIARANERAEREEVRDSVEFRVADAQSLPFDDGTFDVVFCESVATFIEDKQRVADEFVRVTKPGGRIGLNEEVWLKPPPDGLAQQVKTLWGIEPDIPTTVDWLAWLEDAGLRDVEHTVYEFDTRREATQLKRYRFRDMFLMFYRTLVLLLKSAAFRAYVKGRQRAPKDLFKYFGYVLFVGTR
jgi:ubiquinone/menaquinone biosynthesis C-methylase UbiE